MDDNDGRQVMEKNINFLEDYLINIPTKLGSNWYQRLQRGTLKCKSCQIRR
jgi:hypothetical protein